MKNKAVIVLISCTVLLMQMTLFAQKKSGKTTSENDGVKGKVNILEQSAYRAAQKSGSVVAGARCDTSDKATFSKTYNENGYCLRHNVYSVKDSLLFYSIYTYTTNYNPLQINSYLPNGKLVRFNAVKYNNKGENIEAAYYKQDSSLVTKIIWNYDDAGKVIESEMWTSKGLTNMNRLKYNINGDQTEDYLYDADGKLEWRYSRIFDTLGGITEESYWYQDKYFHSKKTFKYDKWQNLSEENEYDRNGYLTKNTSYIYFRDERENWIRKIEYTNGTPVFVTTRKITYFKN